MLTLRREGNTLSVETMSGIVTWDASRGGEITGLAVKNDLRTHELLSDGRTVPGLEVTADGKRLRTVDLQAEIAVTSQDADVIRIKTCVKLHDGAIEVSGEYEIHQEGAVFCNLAMDTPSGKRFELGAASLNVSLDTRDATQKRWAYCSREPKYKRDYSTVHAFPSFVSSLAMSEQVDERELFSLFLVDLGWGDVRFYSNHVEFFIEDWTSYNDGPLSQTRTRAGEEDGLWQGHWHFHEGQTVTVNGAYRYRNRWGFAFGRARTHSGPTVDPAVRNNALGAKICHAFYPHVTLGDKWPWVSMPLKQIPEQPPQNFVGNPALSRADEAKALGADTMILHQFWMRNPGQNNEPPADYQPRDPEWLKAFTDHCHKLDMRVLYYVRGTEMWQNYNTFFEDFLERDLDGLYMDWNTPFCMGQVKCSPLHVSMHNFFHFAKSVRERVGSGGLLIGHTSNASMIGTGVFDAALSGEVSVRHDELLTDPSNTAYYANLNNCGGHLISGNYPDRIAFSSPHAMAICAAMGMTSHPFMEPDIPFDERVAFVKPLWDAMNLLPGKVVRLHNPAYIPTAAVATQAEHLYPSLWQSDAGKALLLVTNVSSEAQSGTVELKLNELDVGSGASVEPCPIPGAFTAAKPDGDKVQIDGVPPDQFAAFLIG